MARRKPTDLVFDLRVRVHLVDGRAQDPEAVRINLAEDASLLDGVQVDVMVSDAREPGLYEVQVISATEVDAKTRRATLAAMGVEP